MTSNQVQTDFTIYTDIFGRFGRTNGNETVGNQ